MKKILALLLALAMLFSLAACGSGGNNAGSNDNNSQSDGAGDSQDAAGGLRVGVFWHAFSDAFLSTVRTALDADLDAAGIAYQDFDGGNAQAAQLEQVREAASSGVNLLIVDLADAGAAQQILDAAGDVPVIFFNRAVEGDGEEGVVLNARDDICFIGADASEAGHMQGKMIGEYLVENYDVVDLNGDGEISYAMFMGDEASVEAICRTRYGVEDADGVLTESGMPPLVYFNASNSDKYQLDPAGAWSNAAAFDFMTANLAEYNENRGNMIELVIANNDEMALGAISALNNAGYNLGDGAGITIPVFGVDATGAAVEAIAAGKMTGTVKQDAQGMADAIAGVAQAVGGGSAMADAVAAVAGAADLYSVAEGFPNKLYVACAPYDA